MRRMKLNITDCEMLDDAVLVRAREDTSSDPMEIVIPLDQIAAITGVLGPPESKSTKKGGK